MNILVTGASGYVGKQLVPYLESQGHQVSGLDSNDFRMLRIKEASSMNSSYWPIYEICYHQKFDAIIHLAVKTHAGGYCQEHPGDQFLINSEINNTILQYWRKYQSQAKFITFGSSCAYDQNVKKIEENYLKGDCEPGYEVYGQIKRHLLYGLKALNKEYGMNYTYLIPSTFYGPGYDLNDKHFIFELIRKISNDEEVVLWGDGTQRRELIYIEDALKIIEKSLTWDQQICNLSSGNDYNIIHYSNIICGLTNRDDLEIKWDITQFVGSKEKKLVNTYLKDFIFTNIIDGLWETIKYYQKCKNINTL